MNKILLKKGLVCGIAIILLGLCITSGTGVNVEKTIEQMSRYGSKVWWKFDEGSGSIAYDSFGNKHGNVEGATWVSGGLEFDGINDYVEFDAHAQNYLGINKTDDYYFHIWFQSTDSGMLYSMSNTNPAKSYFDIFLDNAGHIKVEMGDETCLFDCLTSGTYNDGEWHYVIIIFWGDYPNPTIDIYVDGEYDGSTTEWLSPMLAEDFLTAKVGRDSNDASDFFNGIIYDVKIYKNFPPYGPSLDVEKYVWDDKNGQWVDADTDNEAVNQIKGKVVEFKIVLLNDGDELISNIVLSDFLNDNMTYQSADPEPDNVNHNPPNWDIEWNIPGPLKPGEWKEFKIYAIANGPDGSIDYNGVWAIAPGLADLDMAWIKTNKKSKEINTPFLNILENHPNMFPLLRQLLGL